MDLDLDELDSQVNNLMNGAPKPRDGAGGRVPAPVNPPNPAHQSMPNPPSAQAPDQGHHVHVKHQQASIVAPRRRGSAMDIITPTPRQPVRPPSVAPSREAPRVQPASHVVPEPIAPRQAIAPKPVAEPSDEMLASLDMHDASTAPAEPKIASDWPDPLEYQPPTKPVESPEPEQLDLPAPHDALLEAHSRDEPEPSAAATEPAPTMAAPAEPTTTPFIDAKVQKRPLGAYNAPPAAPAPAVPPTEHVFDPLLDAPEAQAPTAPEPAKGQAETVAQPPESGMEQLRQAAIPPQYQTRDHQPPDDTRPVFDTSHYHGALPTRQPATKKRALLGWILLLVLAAALIAAGYVAYQFMTGGAALMNVR